MAIRQKNVWLGTAGLGSGFGGVAQVARSCVSALTTVADGVCLDRVISLLDRSSAAVGRADGERDYRLDCSNGNRVRFSALMARQMALRPDLIVYDHVDLAQCQTVLPRRLRSPHVVWVHGVEVWQPLPARKMKALQTAELLLFNSHYTRKRFEDHHGDGFRGAVVPLTADLMGNGVVAAQGRKPWILTVGRIEAGRPKGHKEILAVLPQVVKVMPEVQWHVVGAGRQLEGFREQVQASSCGNSIHLHGFLETAELQKLFRQSRAFCMPSYGEGFGIVYLEAMSYGCVPVGSTLDAASEVIGDGGFCVDVHDPSELLNTLLSLLKTPPSDFQTLSDKALARSQQFRPSRFRERVLNLLRATPCLQTKK